MAAIATATPAATQSTSLSESDDADSEPPQSLSTEKTNSSQACAPLSTPHNLQTPETAKHTAASPDGSLTSVKTGVFSFSPSTSPTNESSVASASSFSSLAVPVSSSVTRQFPTVDVDVHDAIPEEDDESDCDTPNEPVTPVSNRQSREGFPPVEPNPETAPTSSATKTLPIAIPTHHTQQQHSHHGHRHRGFNHSRQHSHHSHTPHAVSASDINIESSQSPEPKSRPTTAVNGSFLITGGPAHDSNNLFVSRTQSDATASPDQFRRPSRTSSSASGFGFRRTMTNIFRRSNSQSEKIAFGSPDFTAPSSDPSLADMAVSSQRKEPSRRWSMHRSLAGSQSHSPPSPSSSLEMPCGLKHQSTSSTKGALAKAEATTAEASEDSEANTRSLTSNITVRQAQEGMPTQADFFQNDSKKHRDRASTGLSLHNPLRIVTGSAIGRRNRRNVDNGIRRANSFDNGKKNVRRDLGADPWALPAEAGIGLKARRLSLNLPDDFLIDVIDMSSVYDFVHSHAFHRRKHLGKGVTSKVMVASRKGFPDELYAVKEFRAKSSKESQEDYEKKVKSEYTIAKSLRHPNIVETFHLGTRHGHWTHIMELCSEGDLYSLVEKRYLSAVEREKDRHCLFKQLIQGVNYLHSHGIAHRDIKLENLLISHGCTLKITDFGVSDIFSGIHPGLREAGGRCGYKMDGKVQLCKAGVCGSLPYISPEVLGGKTYYDPRKLDVWSTAVVMIHLIFNAPLWNQARADGSDENKQYESLVRGWEKYNKKHIFGKLKEDGGEGDAAEKEGETGEQTAINTPTPTETLNGRPVIPEERESQSVADGLKDGHYPVFAAFDLFVNPPVLRRILIHMLNPDPKDRPTISQVANLRWIRNIECCQPDGYEDPEAPAAAAPRIDASKRPKTGAGKIYCHDHMPHKMHSAAIGRMN